MHMPLYHKVKAKLSFCTLGMQLWKRMYTSIHSTLGTMTLEEVSGQLHALTALFLVKQPLVPTEEEIG